MMNTLKSPATELVPLAMSSDGVIYVGGSRVTLDSVLAAFNNGSTAEEIVQQFPALALADVYAVLAYYLRRQAEIDEYLRERQATAEQVRRDNEARFDPHGVRARLLARRTPS
jgi:uncharacterized protein (DUF433 family)